MSDGPAAQEGRSLDDLLKDLSALEALANGWESAERNGAQARAEAVDALNAEAFRRLIRVLRDTPGMESALRSAAGDEVVYAVLRRHGILKPSLFERVDTALDSVRPMLVNHGGNAELVAVDGHCATIRFLGNCDGCPASALTFYAGVKKAIQDQVPEISEIKQAKGLGGGSGGDSQTTHFISPFATYQSEGWSYACGLHELADGATTILDIEEHSILLSRFGDRITCFENACAHMGMAMDGGEISDGLITCPHHEFRYSLETGECLTAPEVQLQPHGVRVVSDMVEVRLTQ